MTTRHDNGWGSVAAALMEFDMRPDAHCPEPVVTQLLWVAVRHVDGLTQDLGFGADDREWRLGARGYPDLTGWRSDRWDGIELKSASAQWNGSVAGGAGCWLGADCEYVGGEGIPWQPQHWTERWDVEPRHLVLITHTSRVKRLERQLEGLKSTIPASALKFFSFAQCAELIDARLEQKTPDVDFVGCLLDVQAEPK